MEMIYLLFDGWCVHITKYTGKQPINPIICTWMQISEQFDRWTCLRRFNSNFYYRFQSIYNGFSWNSISQTHTHTHILPPRHTSHYSNSHNNLISFTTNFLLMGIMLNFPFNICANIKFRISARFSQKCYITSSDSHAMLHLTEKKEWNSMFFTEFHLVYRYIH